MEVLRKRKRAKNATILKTCEEGSTRRGKRKKMKGRFAPKQQRRGHVDSPELRKALREFCLRINTIGVQGLLTEFAALKKQAETIGTKKKSAFDANPEKNRFKNVICTDDTRVILTWPPGTNDYIHASWITSSETPKKFICTQGPKENTVEDFWRMIWQEKCKSIIMLCNITEHGEKKCEQYWPETNNPLIVLPGCKLTLKYVKAQDVEENIMQTTVEMFTNEESKHTVEHIQWRDWPDGGVPCLNLFPFRLLMMVKQLTPIVVHCSAGVGRTGTLVGIDLLYSKLEKGISTTLESVVRGLQNDRHGSVQTDEQYLYMHRIFLTVAENKKVITATDVQKFITEYNTFCKEQE
ncbi:hypothetical protein RB195_019682 [Necator americanus]|uniref:Protein-tyrosine phosphatase n=1 Tax=Necator americanus TaxID=51031 RepID=A0ABR1CGX5_NECAM